MSLNEERPIPPEEYECCQSECSPCVWDRYYEKLNAWQARQVEAKKAAEAAAE